MLRALALIALSVFAGACASANAAMVEGQFGFLARTDGKLILYPSEAARSGDERETCIQVARGVGARDSELPLGRAMVNGQERSSGDWEEDVILLKYGHDLVGRETCRGRYIIATAIVAAPEDS